jgi:putative FmdB family regulatory protein
MPIYEYNCKKCDETFEVFFRNREEKMSIACPACKSKKTQRQMSAFAGKIGNTSGAGDSCGSCAATSCSPS